MAEEWIATHRPAYEAGEQVNWAVVVREEGALVGRASRYTFTPSTTTPSSATDR
jgi:hypothetical protein